MKGGNSRSAVRDRLLARTEQLYDKLGRVYRTKTYAVNPTTGAVGSALVSDTWRVLPGGIEECEGVGHQVAG